MNNCWISFTMSSTPEQSLVKHHWFTMRDGCNLFTRDIFLKNCSVSSPTSISPASKWLVSNENHQLPKLVEKSTGQVTFNGLLGIRSTGSEQWGSDFQRRWCFTGMIRSQHYLLGIKYRWEKKERNVQRLMQVITIAYNCSLEHHHLVHHAHHNHELHRHEPPCHAPHYPRYLRRRGLFITEFFSTEK